MASMTPSGMRHDSWRTFWIRRETATDGAQATVVAAVAAVAAALAGGVVVLAVALGGGAVVDGDTESRGNAEEGAQLDVVRGLSRAVRLVPVVQA